MTRKSINIIFPNQLFKKNILFRNQLPIYLIEEKLYFKKFNFHKQKLAFHRASMKYYESFLNSMGLNISYIESSDKLSDIRYFLNYCIKNKIDKVHFYNPIDNSLLNEIKEYSNQIDLIIYDNPSFISTENYLLNFFEKKNFFSHSTFYKQQRKKLNILMNSDGTPFGEKFSFDKQNRKKYPANKQVPKITFPPNSVFWHEAVEYTNKLFFNNFGQLSSKPIYPITSEQSQDWFESFLKNRLNQFGDYEDAIISNKIFLNHSIISPLLNSGLISPEYIIIKTIDYAKENKIPLNSLEGFIRQIIGWREFIFGFYISKGEQSRNSNFWGFYRKIPKSFYSASTGIDPIDDTIKKIKKYGYCHHIERLMILGNFMLLCEFDPNEVYRWFMEVFIDSYDWVMVPNIYGMSQFADGGLFATKPYISGSNYIKKMSDYKNGDWVKIWDGLYWNFINNQTEFFSNNHRLSMMVSILKKMDKEILNKHLRVANNYLKKISL
ncbi:MAG: cryptochrome/photolyase family protein [Candidatus Marinimicrobia bacterium]|nr:cryptochrome/photolyase family protein [Candidatus Neomarinimicrobiota bacterium]